MKDTVLHKYSFLWVVLVLFAGSLMAHWIFAWYSYLDEARDHDQPIVINEYVNMTVRDTMENWQSEMLQIMIQVGGLSILYYVGSSQSREGDERLERKIDFLLSQTPEGRIIKNELDMKYLRRKD
jgi:hypothetical protein